MKTPNLALVPDAKCIEFFRREGRYFALEGGQTFEVLPGTRYYLIALEAAIRHPEYPKFKRKYGLGNQLVYGFIDQVWSGFNELPDVINGRIADQDGDIYTTAAKVNPREREVIQKMADGKSDKEIAEALFVSRHTVTTTIRNLREKLRASSKYHIVARAAEAGII